jgi:hypothetical protein
MTRELEPRIPDGRADAIAAFPDAGVGKTNHREDGEPEGHIDLDYDGQGLDTENRRASEAGKHLPRRCKYLSRRAYGEDFEKPIVMDTDFS